MSHPSTHPPTHPLLLEVLAGSRPRCQGTGYGDGDLGKSIHPPTHPPCHRLLLPIYPTHPPTHPPTHTGLCLKLLLGIDVTHEACFHSQGPHTYEKMEEEGGGGGGGDRGGDGLISNLQRPCSFHYAFKKKEEGGGGEGRGKEEEEGGKDEASDGQIREWHQRFNEERRR